MAASVNLHCLNQKKLIPGYHKTGFIRKSSMRDYYLQTWCNEYEQ